MKKIIPFILLIIFSFTEVMGQAAAPAAAAAGSAATESAIPSMGKIQKMLSSPTGILIMAGIAGVNAGMLYKAAGDQEKESEENIKKIDKILTTFKDSYANYCPAGRNKLEDPKCYCYLDSGKQNTERSNSQICKDLWAKNNYKLDGTASDYSNLATITDPAGCMTTKGQFDEKCNCKKMVDSKGVNACMKSVAINMGDNGIGSAYLSNSGLDKVMKNAASTLSGNANIGNLSDKNLALAIAKQKAMNKAIFDKLTKNPENKLPKMDSDEDFLKLQKSIVSDSDLQKMGTTFGGGALASVSSGIDPKKDKVLSDVKNKLGLELSGSGKGLDAKKPAKKAGMDFNFAEDGAAGSSGQVVDSFPEKNYNYKNSDIVTDDGANIFEIISNRYIQSGLRRLFDDGNSAQ